jgi:hypothetical protein
VRYPLFTRAHIDRVGREIADRRLDRPLKVAINETARLWGTSAEGLRRAVSEIDRATCSPGDCDRLDKLLKTLSFVES